MGNCHFQSENDDNNIKKVSKNDFSFLYVIGRGGFGKVWKVEQKKTHQLYAMKEMLKARVVAKRSVHSVINEKKILSQLYHPLLVNMNYAFDDRENLYLVIDLMNGGDLRYHLAKHRKFSEEQTKFFLACMVLCLEYLHQKSILHRDIKPENLVFDAQGYLKITDLGIARVWNPDNSKDTSGTPGYMAPEVMCKQPHGVAVDYFAMGVIGYECMFGKRPYTGRGRKEIREHILAKQVQIQKKDVPKGWSIEAADFINKLLQRKPLNRLGINGPEDVKNHPWLRNFDFDDLLAKKIQSPFIPPTNDDNFDANYTNSEWKDKNSEQIQQNMQLLDQEEFKKLFNGYYHDENFAEEMLKEKLKTEQLPPTRLPMQVRSSQAALTAAGSTSAKNESKESQSKSNGDPKSQFQNYQKSSSVLKQEKNSNSNQMKRTVQSSSIPQSMEQPSSRASKYRMKGENSDFNSQNNSAFSRMTGSANRSNHLSGVGMNKSKQKE